MVMREDVQVFYMCELLYNKLFDKYLGIKRYNIIVFCYSMNDFNYVELKNK